ncbi:TRAP transporter small permease subunit [Azospirillum halopraeferens]|uniref:TRAP transporter small permease subunit n=1 Tax=Azospirillum halopraeferens TaxID=34010 RepID=UPI0003FFD406|nr:TRAP transporter small permease subunit [Azospirillum halopraeferens]
MNVTHGFVLPHWLYWGALLLFPLVYMLFAGWRERRPGTGHGTGDGVTAADLDETAGAKSRILASLPGNRFTRFADALSQFTGVFVAYWTVIAVLVYFFEVVSRYFLRMPTNWAHESMFLMFGMQYVLAGAYAYLHDAHVRVDLFYARATPRGQAAIDIITHFFFLIFALAFIWTAWTFFSSSMSQNTWFWATGYSDEVSFTEWGIAYWPVKFSLVLGGVLLLIQGISRFVKDVRIFTMEGTGGAHG